MNLSKLSVKRPVTVIMVTLIIIIMGAVSFSRLAVDLFPDIEFPVSAVITQFSGAGPQEVEKMVAKPIEESLATLEGLETLTTYAMDGTAITVLQFDFGTDMDMKAIDIRENVDRVKGYLPEDADEPMVMKLDINAMPIMELSLSGDKSVSELEKTAEDFIKPRLERIEGVASISINGGLDQEVEIALTEEVLTGYGLSTGQLAQIIGVENLNTPLGDMKKGTQTINVRQVGEFESINDIKNLMITLPSGQEVQLKEIANVQLKEKKADAKVYTDGKRTVGISIQKSSDANTVKVAQELRKEIEKIQNELQGANLNIFLDTATYVESSIDNVKQSALIGGLLAILILFLFLRHLKSTLVIGISIPISVIATFILIYFNGITLNMMTLSGLTLGVGMLVDNSIVVLENIFRYRTEGVEIKESAITGANEVRNAIIASTLTTVVVFLPLSFTEGMVSIMFRDFSMTVVMSLIASLLIALTLVPMLSSKLLTSTSNSLMAGTKKAGLFSKVEKLYKRVLSFAIRRRKTIIAITLAIFVSTMSLTGVIGMEFFPATDQGQLAVEVELPEGSSIEKTESYVRKVESIILESTEGELDSVQSTIGVADQRSSMTGVTSTNKANLTIKLVSQDDRTRSDKTIADQIRNALNDISGAKFSVAAQSGMAGSSMIDIKILGEDLNTLQALSDDITPKIKAIRGAKEIESSLEEGLPEVQIKINRERAAQYGLSSQSIASMVKSRVDGIMSSRIKLDDEEIDIIIRSSLDENRQYESLQDTALISPLGVAVPLNQVANITLDQGPSTIMREDQERYVSITGDVFGRDLGSVNGDIEKLMSEYDLPNGFTYKIGGQAEDMNETFTSLGLALILSVVFVYMIIAAQFESLIQPFVIMFSVPLAMSGGLIALLITSTPLSAPAMIGMIMLAGIVVNNAIVLVDAINLRRESGLSRDEAIMSAGPIRLRPILMTTLTTVLGLLPMAIGIGEGSESMAPMAQFVVGGLILSTLLTLIFIPVLYIIADNLVVKFQARRNKRKEKAAKPAFNN
ncbi:MAG: efflux RND transporter permease subunit [Firmicutes bacterium]|nr:efflux RND transporter permease subunit [Bacillota bacterium]